MSRLQPLERWSATAFLLAGVLFIGFAARNGIIAFGDGFSESMRFALYVAFIVPAELAAYVGLLGLYPRLSEHASRLTGAGAVFVGVAGAAIIGFGGGAGAALLAVGPLEPPAVAQLLLPVAVIATILGFLLFGVASLRAGVPSRTAGGLLLIPPATYLLMMTSMVAGVAPDWSAFVLASIQAVAHVAIGVVLRNGGVAADRTAPASDSTA